MGLFDIFGRILPDRLTEKTSKFFARQASRLGNAFDLAQQTVYDELVGQGIIIDRNEFTTIHQDALADSDEFRYYGRLPSNVRPDDRFMLEKPWITDRYGYVVEYDIFDSEGEFVTVGTSRIDTSRRLTQDELLQNIERLNVTNTGFFWQEDTDLRVRGAMFNPNFSETVD